MSIENLRSSVRQHLDRLTGVLASITFVANNNQFHQYDLNNPHNDNLKSVGLDKVEDLPIATYLEATLGELESAYIVPAHLPLIAANYVGTEPLNIRLRKPIPISPIGTADRFNPRFEAKPFAYNPEKGTLTKVQRVFQIDRSNGDFTNPLFELATPEDFIELPSDLSSNGSFKWRCKDIDNEAEESDWSDEIDFTTPLGIVATPSILEPVDGQEVRASSVRVVVGQFITSPGDVDSYKNTQVQISNTLDFSEPLVDRVDVSNTITISDLPEGLYYVRARHIGNILSPSQWCTPILFNFVADTSMNRGTVFYTNEPKKPMWDVTVNGTWVTSNFDPELNTDNMLLPMLNTLTGDQYVVRTTNVNNVIRAQPYRYLGEDYLIYAAESINGFHLGSLKLDTSTDPVVVTEHWTKEITSLDKSKTKLVDLMVINPAGYPSFVFVFEDKDWLNEPSNIKDYTRLHYIGCTVNGNDEVQYSTWYPANFEYISGLVKNTYQGKLGNYQYGVDIVTLGKLTDDSGGFMSYCFLDFVYYCNPNSGNNSPITFMTSMLTDASFTVSNYGYDEFKLDNLFTYDLYSGNGKAIGCIAKFLEEDGDNYDQGYMALGFGSVDNWTYNLTLADLNLDQIASRSSKNSALIFDDSKFSYSRFDNEYSRPIWSSDKAALFATWKFDTSFKTNIGVEMVVGKLNHLDSLTDTASPDKVKVYQVTSTKPIVENELSDFAVFIDNDKLVIDLPGNKNGMVARVFCDLSTLEDTVPYLINVGDRDFQIERKTRETNFNNMFPTPGIRFNVTNTNFFDTSGNQGRVKHTLNSITLSNLTVEKKSFPDFVIL
jgi:hypothetical protein